MNLELRNWIDFYFVLSKKIYYYVTTSGCSIIFPESGLVYVCGESESGKLGIDAKFSTQVAPKQMQLPSPAAYVACGGHHTIILAGMRCLILLKFIGTLNCNFFRQFVYTTIHHEFLFLFLTVHSA